MTTYETVIGMEVHIELQTQSKMFCGCDAHFFGQAPNTHTCPTCLALPGALPVINQEAIAYTIKMGLALNCDIHTHNVFARKNYFYPDLPKGYQISQYEFPLCTQGTITVDVEGTNKKIGITRVHLEEDTGKSTHMGDHSLVDLNRAGVPLMEIVSEPDIRSAEEAFAYVSKLRQIVRYLGISSGDMEKGAMRCEVNLSLRPEGSEIWGTKVEVKNLNSFRSVRNAIAFEVERHTRLLEAGRGDEIVQETRGWDENKRATVSQRSKEDASDYRYFPEPDLPPLNLDESWISELTTTLPELPDAKANRYGQDWNLSLQDAVVLTESRDRAEYFEAVVAAGAEKISPKSAANWVMGEVFRQLNDTEQDIETIKVQPAALVELITLVEGNKINRLAGKEVFAEMWTSGDAPANIVKAKGLEQVDDLDDIIDKIIADNPGPVEEFKSGNPKVIGFLIGQVMRQTKGKANPKVAEDIFRQKLL
ncbi:MAG: Asp-tRNA(Asn)/Glu-tRNA(Gln) amidotransferase subunit GatB [Chloroflexota bacterium]